jgi:hypothetical protein
MLFLYYLLARDEERRMLARFGDGYRGFMARAGVFFPRLPRNRALLPESPRPPGVGFVARAYAVRHLPLGSVGPADVITITPEDLTAARVVLPDVLKDPAVAARLGAARNHPAASSRTSSRSTTRCGA